MSARPGIRECDIMAAVRAGRLLGRPVMAITRGDVTIRFDAPPSPANDDALDRELAEQEARHDDD